MINKRLKFELKMVNERLGEIIDEYNNDLTKGREKISECKWDKSNGTITIFMDSFAYHLFIYKDTFVLAWLRRDINDEHKWIHDGTEYCTDVSIVIRSLRDRIFGGFSPRRGRLWYQNGFSEQRKKQFSGKGKNLNPA